GPDLLGVRVDVLASLIGQRVAPAAALGRLRLDQALVLQLLQGRVDRTWARLPHPAAALGDLLDYLIAVPRLLGQQRQGRGTDITALDPPGPVELGLPRPPAEPHWAEARRAERCLHRPAAPVPGPPAAAAMRRPPAFLFVRAPGLVFVHLFMHLRSLASLRCVDPNFLRRFFYSQILNDISETVGTQDCARKGTRRSVADLVAEETRERRCSWVTERAAGAATSRSSAVDGGHGPGGLEEPGFVDPMPGQLAGYGLLPQRGQFAVAGTRPHRVVQVALVPGEQAVADLPVGGEPHPVAGSTERPGQRPDHAPPGAPPV